MSRFPNFTPPTLGTELTSSEIIMLEELTAAANSGSKEYLRKVSGSIVNASIAEILALADLSDVSFNNLTSGQFLTYNGASWTNSSELGLGTITSVTGGNGLTGGGSNGAVTLNIGAGTGITVNADDVALAVPVVVSSGGTGATSLTDGGLLLGSGTGAITALGVAANGEIPIGDGTGDPVLGTITGTSNQVIVTNSPGSIVLSTPQNIHTAASPTFAGLTLSGLTLGSVLFAGLGGAISQDNANLFWDDTNNRLGIGTSAPADTLHVAGTIRLSGASVIRTPSLGNTLTLQSFDGSQAYLLLGNNFTLNAGAGQLNQMQVGGSNRFRLDDTGIEVSAPAGTLANQILDFFPGLWNNNAGWTNTGDGRPLVLIRSTVNQSAANGYIGLRMNVTETAIGSGVKNLLELQTGGVNHAFVSNLGAAVFNEQGNDADFRIEGDADANLFFVDANTDRIGVGTASPTSFFHLKASTTAAASLRAPAGTAPTTPNEGDIWNDSTQKALIGYIDALNTKLSGVVFAATASATVGNTLTETTLIGSGIGTLTLPANFFVAGKSIRLRATGHISTSLAPNTLNIRFKFGSTSIVATGAQTPAGSLSNQVWNVDAVLTCRTTGAAGTVIAQTFFVFSDNLMADLWPMVTTTTVTINTTAAQTVDLTADWDGGAADAGDTLTGTNCIIEVLN